MKKQASNKTNIIIVPNINICILALWAILLMFMCSNDVFAGHWGQDNYGKYYVEDNGNRIMGDIAWLDPDNNGMYELYVFDNNGYLKQNYTSEGIYIDENGCLTKDGNVVHVPSDSLNLPDYVLKMTKSFKNASIYSNDYPLWSQIYDLSKDIYVLDSVIAKATDGFADHIDTNIRYVDALMTDDTIASLNKWANSDNFPRRTYAAFYLWFNPLLYQYMYEYKAAAASGDIAGQIFAVSKIAMIDRAHQEFINAIS